MGTYFVLKTLLLKLHCKVDRIEEKLEKLTDSVNSIGPIGTVFLSVATRKTLDVLKSFAAPVTASDISGITGRARSVESLYLNELHHQGLVIRTRRGRRVFFTLKERSDAEG